MSEVIITVRGEHESRIAPEEATAHLTITAEGPERAAVVERIVALSEPLRDGLAVRKAQGALREWSSQRVSVWANRPWNSEGKQLALVHYASIGILATFTDFDALSAWLTDAAQRDGVHVDGVSWELTPATRTRTEADVAQQAVTVAVARATAYAQAIGLASVTPLEIADLGLLTDAGQPGVAPLARAAKGMLMSVADSGGGSVSFQPEDIVVTAGVEARFSAR